MAGDHAIESLAQRAETAASRLRQQIVRWAGRQAVILAYRQLFLTPDRNAVSDAGRAVIADVVALTRLGTAAPAGASEAELRERAAMQAVALHIIARIDLGGNELRQLAAKMREAGQQ